MDCKFGLVLVLAAIGYSELAISAPIVLKIDNLQVHQANKTQNELSTDGGSERGGGDARLIRSLIFESKRERLVKSVKEVFTENYASTGMTQVSVMLNWISVHPMKLKSPKAQAILKDMIERGFEKDLVNTKFSISDACLDKNAIEKTAVATMNAPRTDICVNPHRIVEDFGPYIQDSDIMGLMMHEFAHHYGYEDFDHSFAAAVAQEYQRDNEERNQDGEPLNFLIK